MKRAFAFIGLMVLVLASTLGDLDQTFSLQEPYFLGSGSWDANGRTITMDSAVRLTKNNVKGSSRLWCRIPFTFKTWDIATRFSISGKNPGGDGLAMWLTDKIISNDGKAFGAPVQWNGLMIAVDTFDNNKNGDNPIIYGIMNNGATTYRPETDGTEMTSYRCKAPVRNTKTPVTLFVKRTPEKSIIVSTLIEGTETACFTIPNVELPEKTYLAYSASSLFSNNDIHDIIDVRISHPKEEPKKQQPIKPKTAETNSQKAKTTTATTTNKASTTASTTNTQKPAATTGNKKTEEKSTTKNAQKPNQSQSQSQSQKGKSTEQKDPNVIAIEEAVEKMKAEVAASFETIISSNEAFSKIIIELASHPPRDYNEELKGLSTVMTQLRQIVNNIPATKNTEELNKIKKNLDEVKEHLETVTQVMGILTARLNASQDDTTYAIRRRSSTGHWAFFVIFEAVFALGVVFWRQMKVEKAKVI